MKNADFSKMTYNDYISWLHLFKETPDRLRRIPSGAQHTNNLIKSMNGHTLSMGDLPSSLFKKNNEHHVPLIPWNPTIDADLPYHRYPRKVQLYNSEQQRDLLNKLRPSLSNSMAEHVEHFASL